MTEEKLQEALDDFEVLHGRPPGVAYLHPKDRRALALSLIQEPRPLRDDVRQAMLLSLMGQVPGAEVVVWPSGSRILVDDTLEPGKPLLLLHEKRAVDPTAVHEHRWDDDHRYHHDGEYPAKCILCAEVIP